MSSVGKTVRVDFNMVTDGGLVPASPSFASDGLRIGDRVEAIDFADPDMSFIGVVEDIDDKGFAYLRMEWEPVDAEEPPRGDVAIRFVSSAEVSTGGQPVRSEDHYSLKYSAVV